jgi:hypothetical protein
MVTADVVASVGSFGRVVIGIERSNVIGDAMVLVVYF